MQSICIPKDISSRWFKKFERTAERSTEVDVVEILTSAKIQYDGLREFRFSAERPTTAFVLVAQWIAPPYS